MPKFKEIVFGKSAKTKKKKLTTPLQDELLQLIQEGATTGKGPFADIFGAFNEEEFNKGVVNPALKNFQENILPKLQEKFIANNQVLGTDFGRAQAKAGTDLQSELAALMYQAQQKQKENKMRGVELGLNRQGFENVQTSGYPGLLQEGAKALAQAGGYSAGNWGTGSQTAEPTGGGRVSPQDFYGNPEGKYSGVAGA